MSTECYNCSGKGNVVCNRCLGKGSIKKTIPLYSRPILFTYPRIIHSETVLDVCPKCNGKGIIKCKICKGTGLADHPKMIKD